ncbi:protein jagged-1-like [Ambystoma mexicanum]|uniref:protein jagged-1-like n=1 Tax=Ambystoma mexicanum TaxID=8296 RepID=UPI0037E7EDEB
MRHRRSALLPLLPLLPLLLLGSQPQILEASGTFELQIKMVQNYRGLLASGQCCKSGTPPCTRDECNTYFRVCLKEYQLRVAPSGACVMGTGSTPVLGGSTFTIRARHGEESPGRILIPFHFAWPKSYSLILEAWDMVNSTADDPDERHLIDRITHSGMLSPGDHWQPFQHHGRGVVIEYKIRVRCGEHYYGPSCNKLCRRRDDFFGHHSCDAGGHKVCLDGWSGPECKQATCRQGCHETHGFCELPGECRCHYGWSGPNCDDCIPFPGCIHGTCSEPWKCICETNWGGLLCDKDLNVCGSRQPCQNGGTCTNTEPNEHQCICPQGFHGRNCEKPEFSCQSTPCFNGGTCLETGDGFECLCPPDWTGGRCNNELDPCISRPCAHGGTCQSLPSGFVCLCPPEWTGRTCQLDTNECEHSPCVHARGCKDLIGGYFCDCREGWTGQNCDTRSDVCLGRCLNGGKCQVMGTDYKCLCPPGFMGADCAIEVTNCTSLPCQHGGRCVQVGKHFLCSCPSGVTGSFCEEFVRDCDPNPCPPGTICQSKGGSYACSCADDSGSSECWKFQDPCPDGACSGNQWIFLYVLAPVTIFLLLCCLLCSCVLLRRRRKAREGDAVDGRCVNNLPDAMNLIQNVTRSDLEQVTTEETQLNGSVDLLFPTKKVDGLDDADIFPTCNLNKLDLSNLEREKLNKRHLIDCEVFKL